MGQADFLVLGDYNAVCYECGKKFKASKLRAHWQGYMVCPKCWEPRHPQDFAGPVPAEKPPPWTQPVPPPVFVDSAVPDYEPYDPTEES